MQASKKGTSIEEKCIAVLDTCVSYVLNPFYLVPKGFEPIYLSGLARCLFIGAVTSWGLGVYFDLATLVMCFFLNDFLFFKDMLDIANDIQNDDLPK